MIEAAIEWIRSISGASVDGAWGAFVAVGIFVLGAISTAFYKFWKLLTRKPPAPQIRDEPDIAKNALYLARQFVEAAKEKQRDLETENSQLREALAGQDTQAEKALADAIEGLNEDAEVAEDRAPFDKALAELAEGRPDAAENLFAEILDRRKAEGQAALKEAAEAARHIGAIAFYHETQKALAAYVEATELDPDDAEAWNQLGHLQHRLGNLAAAETAYQSVLRLGNNIEDQALLAVAYGNLGIVFHTRGDLDEAEGMYRKALALFDALGRKEGMANQYGNLGNVYLTRGDIAAACQAWDKSRDLFTGIGAAHMVEEVLGWMKDAGCES